MKRICYIPLIVVLVLSVSAISNIVDVHAEEENTGGILYGTENISNAMIDSNGTLADSHIWFGNKTSISDFSIANFYYYCTPRWRVLDSKASNGNSNTSDGISGRMFLMSEYSMAGGGAVGYMFNASTEFGNRYQGSYLQKSVMDRLYNSGFFSTVEKNAMVAQEKIDEAGNVYNKPWQDSSLSNTDYLFPLSVFELKKYISSRASTTNWDFNGVDPNLITNLGSEGRTNAEAAATGPSTRSPGWWLRTPQGSFAGKVTYSGGVANDIVSQNNAIRPAFNLNLGRVLFVSSASRGKQSENTGQSGLKYVSPNNTNDWKLTLLDDSRSDFSIGSVTKDINDNTIAFSYSGAITGYNEYLSAIIMDSNDNIKYYGRILALENGNAMGTALVDISRCYTNSQDKLYIINEHYNGDYLSDYSSNLCDAGNLFEHTVTHSLFEVERIEPTCTESGKSGYWECSACGKLFADGNSIDEITYADTIIPANGHSLQRVPAVEPKCLTTGNIEYWKCLVCSLLFKDSQGEEQIKSRTEYILDALGHSWNAWEYYNETLHHRLCSNDSTHEETGEHDWASYYITDIEPTCIKEGSKSIHCTVCLATKPGTEEAIPTIEHNYGDWTVSQEVTCTTDGSKEKVCTVCGDKVIETIPSQGHVYSDMYEEDLAPTCTAEGSKSKHCVKCGEIDESTITPVSALGHSFADWEEVTPNTCEGAGVHRHSCSVCGLTESEATDPKGHDVEDYFTIDVPATCTTDGSKSKHCSRCDAVFDSEVITATGHNYGDWKVTKEETCIEKGSKEKVCSKCNDKITEEIAAKGHLWNIEPTVDKSATCTRNGLQSIHCARCDETKDAEAIVAVGHTWKHITNAAGLLKSGSEYDQCSVCKKKQNVKTLAGYATYYVKSFKVKKAKKAFTAKWKKQSKANQKKFNGYQIRYSTKSDMSGSKFATASKKSKSKKIKKLKAKTKYYVQVRTYTKSGGTTFYSKWSAKKSVKTK